MPATNLRRRKVDGVYYFRARIHGRRVWRSTGCHDLERARVRARTIERAVRDADLGLARVAPLVREWWADYHAAYSPKKRAPHRDKQLVHAFLERYGHVRLDQVKKSDCERWATDRLKDRGRRPPHKFLAPGSVRREMGFLKAFFERAIEDGHIKVNPWKKVKAPEDVARTRVLTLDEEAKLRSVLRADYDRLLTVILGTGAREAEVLGLKPEHIRSGLVWLTGKFGKTRRVPLRHDVRQALEAQRQGNAYWTQDPSTLRQTLAEACERAGIPHTTIHDLRRTFASRCAASGKVPPKMLQEWMGHSSIEVTMKHYVQVDDADAARVLETVELITGATVVPITRASRRAASLKATGKS
jgi:integrase